MLVSEFHFTDDYGNVIVWRDFQSFQCAMHFFFDNE